MQGRIYKYNLIVMGESLFLKGSSLEEGQEKFIDRYLNEESLKKAIQSIKEEPSIEA